MQPLPTRAYNFPKLNQSAQVLEQEPALATALVAETTDFAQITADLSSGVKIVVFNFHYEN